MKSPLLKCAAFLTIAPFLVGFSPPEEPGTYVSASAGKGRFLSSPGCARPQLVDYADQQVGAYHQKQFAWGSTKAGAGLDLEIFESRQKECTEENCRNADTAWHDNRTMFALSPFLTLDWKWVGVSLGAYAPLQAPPKYRMGPGIENLGGPLYARESLRLGSRDMLFASLEMQNGQPLYSDGGLIAFGLGGRVLGTDLWLATKEPSPDGGIMARLSREVGPFRLRVAGSYARSSDSYHHSGANDFPGDDESFSVKVPEYAMSAGLDYRLPW